MQVMRVNWYYITDACTIFLIRCSHFSSDCSENSRFLKDIWEGDTGQMKAAGQILFRQ